MRYLLRSLVCVSLSFCIVFSNSFCEIAKADSTTYQSLSFNSTRSSGYSGSFSVGTYSLLDNSFTSTSRDFTTNSDGSLNLSSFSFVDSSFSSDSDYFYFGVDLSDILNGMSASNSARILFNNLALVSWDPDYIGDSILPFQYFALANSLPLYSCYATVEYSATGVINTAHIGGFEAFNTISLGSPFSASPVSNTNRIMNLDFNLTFDIPAASDFIKYEGSYTRIPDSVYDVQIESCTVHCIFSPDYMVNRSGNIFGSTFYNNDNRIACYLDVYNTSNYVSSLFVNLNNKSSGSDSFISTGFSSINQGISSLGNSITTQISQVKTQLTNSTNTITTKIDTMSQDIQTGLQNVVQSAQQNTQNIINTVTTKVDEVKTGITEVKDSIIDLPNKISEMLIGLVVPDEQAMIEQKEQWDTLLAERFGVVYESVEVMDTVAGSFTNATQQSTITLPSVTVPLVGEEFTFGGYDVEVVPEGFGMLADALKLIIDIVVTLAFINAMKNRYEQLVSR